MFSYIIAYSANAITCPQMCSIFPFNFSVLPRALSQLYKDINVDKREDVAKKSKIIKKQEKDKKDKVSRGRARRRE